MTTPERYTNTCGSSLCMDRAPDGEWVSHDDYLALRAEVETLNAELSRLEVIAGYGGVSSDAPERLILASEVYDGVQSCDKWCDVRRVVDDGQPMPESATAYVRADRAERLAEALRDICNYSMSQFASAYDLINACQSRAAAAIPQEDDA